MPEWISTSNIRGKAHRRALGMIVGGAKVSEVEHQVQHTDIQINVMNFSEKPATVGSRYSRPGYRSTRSVRLLTTKERFQGNISCRTRSRENSQTHDFRQEVRDVACGEARSSRNTLANGQGTLQGTVTLPAAFRASRSA